MEKFTKAAFDGNINQVRSTLGRNADYLNKKNKRGQTALYCAARNGHREVVEFLLERNADLTVTEKNGSTPLHAAAYYNHRDVCAVLLDNGADPKALNNFEGTPISEAKDAGHTELAEFLDAYVAAPEPAAAAGTSTAAADEVNGEAGASILTIAAASRVPTLRDLAVAVIKDEIEDSPEAYLEPFSEVPDPLLNLIFDVLTYTTLLRFSTYKKDNGDAPFAHLVNSKTLNKGMRTEEDAYRELFAQQRDAPILNDPHLMLVDVYENEAAFTVRDDDDHEKTMLKGFSDIAEKYEHKPEAGSPGVVPRDDFDTRFSVFTENQLNGLNWDNVFCAGGAVLACLQPTPHENKSLLRDYYHARHNVRMNPYAKNPSGTYQSSDVDLFLYGLKSQEEATAKLEEIYEVIKSNTIFTNRVVRTPQAITFISQYPYRHIQVITRLYKSPAEVLMGFDLDCVTVGYDGEKVWALPRAVRALSWRHNLVDSGRRSTTYEARLMKYARRGFKVAVEGVKPHLINEELQEVKWRDPAEYKGLAKLIVLENNYKHKIAENGTGYGWNKPLVEWYSAFPLKSPTMKKEDVNTMWGAKYVNDQFSKEAQAEYEIASGGGHGSDYDAAFIPWGPRWTAELISVEMGKRYCSLMYGADEYGGAKLIRCEEKMETILKKDDWYDDRINDDPESAEVQELIKGEGDGTSVPTHCAGELVWMTVNPGTQKIGSFKPEDGDFVAEAYPDGVTGGEGEDEEAAGEATGCAIM